MRIACLDLPAFPLQLVWRHEPSWRTHPVVVVESDRPQGEVLWVCERARAAGVLVGQRYAHALSLCSGLRARVVPPEQIAEAIIELRRELHQLSPSVEPGAPGTFWLDGDGLERVAAGRWADGAGWGAAIADAVAKIGYRGAVVVGFSRFATYAIARSARRAVTVLASDAEERATASAVPLARLDVDRRLRDHFARLAVRTVGEMVRLPGGGILERFGSDAHRLYQLAARESWDPLIPQPPPEALEERTFLDDEEDDIERLGFVIKAPLDRLLDRLAARHRALTALYVELSLKHAVGHVSPRVEIIKPAQPTLDGRALLRLLHLRLSGAPPVAPINAVRVWPDHVAATREQLALFAERPRRDLRAANEALAQLRAELGEDAVVRPVLRDGHLPEARFGWERVTQVVPAAPREDNPLALRPLVRRVFAAPQQLPPQPRLTRDDGWLLSGLAYGAVVRIVGPYIVSGGWWAREVHREYHFAEFRHGQCLWLFYDRNRRQWFSQGTVE